MKDARFSLNSKAVFRPTQNGTVIATSIQTVDQLQQRSGKVIEIVIEQVVPRAISGKDALYGFTHVATHILS